MSDPLPGSYLCPCQYVPFWKSPELLCKRRPWLCSACLPDCSPVGCQVPCLLMHLHMLGYAYTWHFILLALCQSAACYISCAASSLSTGFYLAEQARTDHAMACRLTWTRRLLMALDAARGLLYLHSHKPIILHRDLKSPNLFVNSALHVKVG